MTFVVLVFKAIQAIQAALAIAPNNSFLSLLLDLNLELHHLEYKENY